MGRSEMACPFLLNYMADTTPLPNSKLTPWWLAVGHAISLLRQRIAENEANGALCGYDKRQLERLEDMEMFLQMSWDIWMRPPGIGQTAVEESK